MNHELLATVALLLLFLMLIGITNYLYKHFGWTSEKSRKFIHVAGGLLCLVGFSFIHSHWYVLALCAIAFTILLFTFIKKSLPSIHNTSRVSFGSILFPIPIYISFLAADYGHTGLYFYLPTSLLTISDTLAEWGGNKWGHRTMAFFARQKTLAGSLCFAISSFVISCFLISWFMKPKPLQLVAYSCLCMFVTTLAELLTLKGFDNLTVPVSALILIYLIA